MIPDRPAWGSGEADHRDRQTGKSRHRHRHDPQPEGEELRLRGDRSGLISLVAHVVELLRERGASDY